METTDWKSRRRSVAGADDDDDDVDDKKRRKSGVYSSVDSASDYYVALKDELQWVA